jgi:hypothetical protein
MVQYHPNPGNTITVPKSAERSTIVVLADDGSVVDFEYRPGTDLAQSVNNRDSGDRVQVTVVAGKTKTTGTIVRMDADTVTLVSNGELILINGYDRLSLKAPNDYLRPRLLLANDSAPVTVSYLLSSIAWFCSGTAIISNTTMHLRLSGTINNNTETDIRATVKLVAGDVRQNRDSSESYPRSALASAAPQMRRETVATSLVEDYTSYDVGARTIHSEDVAELGVWDIPVHKIYVHETHSYDEVNYGYRFKATDFLPACNVNVYTGKSGPIGSYMGSGHIQESQKDDEVDLILGGSTIVQCLSELVVDDVEITDEKLAKKYELTLGPRQWRLLTTELTTTISNTGSDPANLILRHFINDSRLVSIDCKEFKQRKNGYLEWLFQVPPERKNEKFVCTIVTALMM